MTDDTSGGIRPRLYPVNEIFSSLQGEGYHTGTAATFVRFSGCNRRCAFCDTDHSAVTMRLTAAEITARVVAAGLRHVVLTGGEPSMWADDDLCAALHDAGCYIQIETNGSQPVSPLIDWVTCSPKEPPLLLDRADELKVVFDPDGVGDGFDPEPLVGLMGRPPHLFLQPCSGLNTAAAVSYILSHPHWRLSLQTHKLIDIR